MFFSLQIVVNDHNFPWIGDIYIVQHKMQRDILEKDTEIVLEKLLHSARDTDLKVSYSLRSSLAGFCSSSVGRCMQSLC